MSKKFIAIVGVILLSGLLIFTAGCFTETTEKGNTETKSESNGQTETVSNENDSPIKKFDFKNFSYPLEAEAKDGKGKALTLKDGKLEMTKESNGATLGKIQYADLNGDKAEEAIINLSVEGEKDAKSNRVYVYTLENDAPKLLWNFETPAGEEKGLKDISADKGNLLVEIYGDAKFENGKWTMTESKDKKTYTITQLKWDGKAFAVEGKPEVKEIDSKT